MGNNLTEFKFACKEFLSKQGIARLRTYARDIGVECPTKKNIAVLVNDIVAVLCGELAPVPRSKKGAPVKDESVDPKILLEIERLKRAYLSDGLSNLEGNGFTISGHAPGAPFPTFDFQKELQKILDHPNVLEVADPRADKKERRNIKDIQKPTYRGQLETINGVSCLLPLNCMDSDEKVIISVELIREYDLREGDVVSCHAEKRQTVFVATQVLTVNDIVVGTLKRSRFNDCEACYAKERMHFASEANTRDSLKYLDWLVPMGMGQRVSVVSAPKAGKTSLLLDIAKAASTANHGVHTLVLLIDQSPETVAQFRKSMDADSLVYTTYEDEPERQVFAAEFLLKRAKRLVESGKDVLLIVDSLNTLARAYNQTAYSEGGKALVSGLDSKSLHYIKKFFGAARCMEKGGSLTIIGAVSASTGNPADEVISSEICALANLELHLSDLLALKRVYPAIDLLKTRTKQATLFSKNEEEFDAYLKNVFIPKFGEESLLEHVQKATSYEKLVEEIIQKK